MISIIIINPIKEDDYRDLSLMVGELLNEIMEKIDTKAFNYNHEETQKRAKLLVDKNKYWIFIAKDTRSGENVGFVSLYESYALYSEGAYGTIPELYVRENWRNQAVGECLLEKVKHFSIEKKWRRIEVTTPPLPEFDRTLNFYQKNNFEITGGRKLKMDICMI